MSTDGLVAHVLVVEDEPMIGRILEHKLLREGHRVTWARDCAGCAAALAAGDVDVALVDVTLDRDGIDFMSSSTTTPRCGWGAMVAQRDEASQVRARASGCAAVVIKPFKPTAVAALVAQLLVAGAPV
jgi:DNA-binding response OmpR family regulator